MSINKPVEKVEVHVANRSSSGDIVDVTVNERRRRLAKFAVGAPVLVTLASRPVFAGQCLSNMMSGNLSDPNRGQCSKGWSPGGWGQIGGNIGAYSTSGAWVKAGFSLGTFQPNVTKCQPANQNKPDCYAGGTLLSEIPSALIKEVFPVGTTMLQALNVPYSNTLTRHFVTAYLNASLSENDPNFQYVLTTAQVLAIAGGGPLPPAYGTNVKAFLDSTWS